MLLKFVYKIMRGYGFSFEKNNQNNIKSMNTIDKGNLQVGVYLEDISKPADGANVNIFKLDEQNAFENITTDISGKSENISLACPPLEYSMDYNMPKPYSEYNISISFEDYEPVDIKGVQIFSNTTSIQDIILKPKKNKEDKEIITVNTPVLWGDYPEKIPESEIKKLPEQTGFVVLPKPVIPEFIIVHEGSPKDKNAKNRYIYFKDYIKNVACSEIYSTWPKETLKANILAIISFTLNRVYTEWYRSQGYNFTITNVTNFDQAFSYGRTIFKEISHVVEEIFTTYITKPNIRQPLFTQYCDGKKVQCPNWMTQWGSKTLGDSGYRALNILKNYYGTEVYLTKADKVEGVPISYPGSTLKIGSSGKNVKIIQEQLNKISNNYPALKKVKVDGIYGEQTREVVKKFQEIFNLPITGVVDYATWYKISYIFTAVSKLVG